MAVDIEVDRTKISDEIRGGGIFSPDLHSAMDV